MIRAPLILRALIGVERDTLLRHELSHLIRELPAEPVARAKARAASEEPVRLRDQPAEAHHILDQELRLQERATRLEYAIRESAAQLADLERSGLDLVVQRGRARAEAWTVLTVGGGTLVVLLADLTGLVQIAATICRVDLGASAYFTPWEVGSLAGLTLALMVTFTAFAELLCAGLLPSTTHGPDPAIARTVHAHPPVPPQSVNHTVSGWLHGSNQRLLPWRDGPALSAAHEALSEDVAPSTVSGTRQQLAAVQTGVSAPLQVAGRSVWAVGVACAHGLRRALIVVIGGAGLVLTALGAARVRAETLSTGGLSVVDAPSAVAATSVETECILSVVVTVAAIVVALGRRHSVHAARRWWTIRQQERGIPAGIRHVRARLAELTSEDDAVQQQIHSVRRWFDQGEATERARELADAEAHRTYQQALRVVLAKQHSVVARVDAAVAVAARLTDAVHALPRGLVALGQAPVQVVGRWLDQVVDTSTQLAVRVVHRVRQVWDSIRRPPSSGSGTGGSSTTPWPHPVPRSPRAAVLLLTSGLWSCQPQLPPACSALIDNSGSMYGAHGTQPWVAEPVAKALDICAEVTQLVPGTTIDIRVIGRDLTSPPVWQEPVPSSWPAGNITQHKRAWLQQQLAQVRAQPALTPVPHSDIIRAVTLAARRLNAAPAQDRYLVVLSDGRDERSANDPSAYAWHLGRAVPNPDTFVAWLQAEHELPALQGIRVVLGGVYPHRQPDVTTPWGIQQWTNLTHLWQQVFVAGGALTSSVREDVIVADMVRDLTTSNPGN